MPSLTIVIMVIGFLIHLEIPVGRCGEERCHCAYSLKSTATDMNAFCEKLMEQID